MSHHDDWEELIERHLRGELTESEMERLAELLDSDPSARKGFVEQVHWDTQLAEVVRDAERDVSTGQLPPRRGAFGARFFAGRAATIRKRARSYTLVRSPAGIAAILSSHSSRACFSASRPPNLASRGSSGSAVR